MSKLNICEIKRRAIKVIEPDYSYIDGKYLREFRRSFKMSQSLLADYLGVTKKAIEKWEQGKNKLNPVVIRMVYLIEQKPEILDILKKVEDPSIISEKANSEATNAQKEDERFSNGHDAKGYSSIEGLKNVLLEN